MGPYLICTITLSSNFRRADGDAIGSSGAVGFQVVPVQVMVVNKCAIENESSMRLQRLRNYIRRFRNITPIHRRSQLSLGVRLYNHAAEIRNLAVHLVKFLSPPSSNLWIERIEGVQSTDLIWHVNVHRHPQLHAVRSKYMAIRASFAMKSGSRMWMSAFTLLTMHPLMPTDASNLAYSVARLDPGAHTVLEEIDCPA